MFTTFIFQLVALNIITIANYEINSGMVGRMFTTMLYTAILLDLIYMITGTVQLISWSNRFTVTAVIGAVAYHSYMRVFKRK